MSKRILLMCSVAVSALSFMTTPIAFADNTSYPGGGNSNLLLASINTHHAGGLANLATSNPALTPGTTVATHLSDDNYAAVSRPNNDGKQLTSVYILTNNTAPQDELPTLVIHENDITTAPGHTWLFTSTETMGGLSGYSITANNGYSDGGADVLAGSRPDVGYGGGKFSMPSTKEWSYSTGTSGFDAIIANSGDSLGGEPLVARTGSDARYFNKVANTRQRIANKFSVTFAQSGKAFGSANLLASNTLNAPFNTVAVSGYFESGSRCGHNSGAGGGFIPQQGFT